MCRMKSNYFHGNHLKIFDDGRYEESRYINDKRTEFVKKPPVVLTLQDIKQVNAFATAKSKLKPVLAVRKELTDEKIVQNDLKAQLI